MAYRPYQIEGLTAVYGLLREHQRVLAVLPTGGGKTVIAEMIANHAIRKGRLLYFGVHRRELVRQTAMRFEAAGIHCGVIMAGDKREYPDAPVQVFSVDTLVRREVKAPDVLLLDEAHNLAKYASLIKLWPECKVIGLTATPVGPLQTMYSAMHVISTPSQLIADGYLVDVEAWGLVSPDMTGVSTSGDDYQQESAERVVMEAVDDVVNAWFKRAEGLPTLGFAQSVRHSVTLRDRFRDRGIDCEHVDANTPDEQRRDFFARFKAGTLPIILNYDIISEGFDAPDCRCVLLARATKSPRVYLQQVGRGLRTAPGKEHCVLLDCAGNVKRLWWPTADVAWELGDTAAVVRKKKSDDAVRTCEECYRAWRSSDGPACPYCGWKKEAKEIRVKARNKGTAKLERTLTDGAVKPYDAKAADDLKRWNDEGKRRGHKPGYCIMRFKTRYGRWPNSEERRIANLT